jgi:hypothetical protein
MEQTKKRESKGRNSEIHKYLRSVRKGFKTLIECLEEGCVCSNRDLEKEISILKKDLERIREHIEGERLSKDN